MSSDTQTTLQLLFYSPRHTFKKDLVLSYKKLDNIIIQLYHQMHKAENIKSAKISQRAKNGRIVQCLVVTNYTSTFQNFKKIRLILALLEL